MRHEGDDATQPLLGHVVIGRRRPRNPLPGIMPEISGRRPQRSSGPYNRHSWTAHVRLGMKWSPGGLYSHRGTGPSFRNHLIGSRCLFRPGPTGDYRWDLVAFAVTGEPHLVACADAGLPRQRLAVGTPLPHRRGPRRQRRPGHETLPRPLHRSSATSSSTGAHRRHIARHTRPVLAWTLVVGVLPSSGVRS